MHDRNIHIYNIQAHRIDSDNEKNTNSNSNYIDGHSSGRSTCMRYRTYTMPVPVPVPVPHTQNTHRRRIQIYTVRKKKPRPKPFSISRSSNRSVVHRFVYCTQTHTIHAYNPYTHTHIYIHILNQEHRRCRSNQNERVCVRASSGNIRVLYRGYMAWSVSYECYMDDKLFIHPDVYAGMLHS